MNGFDKAAQIARAAQFSQSQAAMGLSKPVLPMPIISRPIVQPAPPAPAFTKVSRLGMPVLDGRGVQLRIGDEVVYTRCDSAALMVGKVVNFSQSKKSVTILGKKYAGSSGSSEFYKPALAVIKV